MVARRTTLRCCRWGVRRSAALRRGLCGAFRAQRRRTPQRVRYSRPDLQGEQLFVVALPPGVILLRRLFPSTAPDHSLLRIRLFFLLWLGWNQFFELHAPSPIAHLDSCVLPLADRALACGGPYPRLCSCSCSCSCSCRRRPYDERHRCGEASRSRPLKVSSAKDLGS